MAREKANGFIYIQYILLIIQEKRDRSMSSCFAGMCPDVKSREVGLHIYYCNNDFS